MRVKKAGLSLIQEQAVANNKQKRERKNMHKFKSKPMQVGNGYVLCQDGSIWLHHLLTDCFEQIAEYEPATKTKKSEKGYTEKFEEFWKTWGSNVNNSCPKVDAFKKWNSLSLKEQSDATSFITAYAKSNNDHQYLKRANTYLSNKMWESAEHIKAESPTSIAPSHKAPEMPDMNVDLKVVF